MFCQSDTLDKIIEYFDTLLVCLGLKERKIDQLLKDPIAFLKLLHPEVRVDNPHDFYRELGVSSNLRNILSPLIDAKNHHGETILYLLCKKEGEAIDLPDGENLTIGHEMIKHVQQRQSLASVFILPTMNIQCCMCCDLLLLLL